MPLADPEVEAALNDVYRSADAFLFGRWTFEVFAGSWGTIPAMRESAVGAALNSKPRYVASSSLTSSQASATWKGTTALSGDLAVAVTELKEQPEGRLLVPGGGTLIRWLLAHDLVDEINLFLAPVIIGQGTRLFPETGPDKALELEASTVMSNGVMVQTYGSKGRPSYGQTAKTTSAWGG